MYNLQEAYFGIYIQDQVDLWVSELVEEGYDIDQYTDDELLEAFVIERKNEDPKGVANKAAARHRREVSSRLRDAEKESRE